MVSLLKGLLGKSPRPIIVCGKLFADNRTIIRARVENYHVIFNTTSGGDILNPNTIEHYDNKLKATLRQFEDYYGKILLGYQPADGTTELHTSVDPFTGAVIIESETYQALQDYGIHTPGAQLTAAQEALAKAFMIKQIQDYFEIYLNLLNTRIVSQHMPVKIKAHMVKGLFQPIVVETAAIRSPLRYGENTWLYNYFQPNEVYLERFNDGTRKLNFSCEAMCDIADTFGIKPIRELDRRDFMLMMCLTMLAKLSQEDSQAMYSRHGYYMTRIMEKQDELHLFTALSSKAFN